MNTTSYLVTSLISFQVLTQEFRNFLHQVNLELKVILIYSFSLTQSLVLFHFCVRLMITHIIYSFIVISTHFTWNDIFRPFMVTFPFPKCKVLYFSVTIHIFLHQNNTKNVFSFIFSNLLLIYCIIKWKPMLGVKIYLFPLAMFHKTWGDFHGNSIMQFILLFRRSCHTLAIYF